MGLCLLAIPFIAVFDGFGLDNCVGGTEGLGGGDLVLGAVSGLEEVLVVGAIAFLATPSTPFVSAGFFESPFTNRDFVIVVAVIGALGFTLVVVLCVVTGVLDFAMGAGDVVGVVAVSALLTLVDVVTLL